MTQDPYIDYTTLLLPLVPDYGQCVSDTGSGVLIPTAAILNEIAAPTVSIDVSAIIDEDSPYRFCFDLQQLKAITVSPVDLNDFEAFYPGEQDFCIEVWVRVQDIGANYLPIFCYYGNGTRVFQFYYNTNGSFRASVSFDGITRSFFEDETIYTLPTSWHHLALSREGDIFRFFVDGVLTDTLVSAQTIFKLTTNANNAITFNKVHDYSNSGHIQVADARITKGHARFTEDFTPRKGLVTIDSDFSLFFLDLGSTEIATEIAGVITLDGSPVQADLYLVDLNALTPVQSSISDGSYQILDSGNGLIIPDSNKLVVICDYGTGVRPLAHGPVTPVDV